jgi:Flp pilus assembly protein TadD
MSADAYKGIGLCFGKDDQHEQAEAAFLRALEIAPGMAVAHNGLGVVYLRQKRPVEARVEFERALALDPTLVVARSNLENLPPEMSEVGEATP